MKIRTVLSGITALLLVGTFYSFAFCMVEDVNDTPISMDYYYSTETDAKSGEVNGEAITAFIPEEDQGFVYGQIAPNNDKNQAEVNELIHNIADAPKKATQTEVPDNDEFKDTTVVAEIDSVDEVGYYPAEDDDTLGDDLSDDDDEDIFNSDETAQAVEQDVYAEDDRDNRLLSKLDAEPVITSIPIDYNFETVASNPINIETVPAVSSADVVMDFTDIVTVPEITTTIPEVTTVTDAGAAISGETFTIKSNGSIMTLNAYDAVCLIVNNEVSSYFSDEAIKAQAVAAYSYLKYHADNGLTANVLLRANPPQRICDMVSSVWGKTCYYNGAVAQTVYMASSSGYTASSVNVWGGNLPYLVGVECPFDVASDPNYGLTTRYTESDIRLLLESNLGITLSDSPENWLQITSYHDVNYVSQISVDGQTTISGRKLRENILSYKLKSICFDVTYSDGYFVFKTYGYGHGVGMSQNGANILAKMGYSYDQILKYYFTGIDVQ